MNHTSLRWPRWPILKTFPATLFRPRPKLKLYLFHALLTISVLSMYGGTTTAVTVSLNHSSLWVQFFRPHASTASLQYQEKAHRIYNSGTTNIHIVLGGRIFTLLLCPNGYAFQSHCQVLPQRWYPELLSSHTAVGWKGCMAKMFPIYRTSSSHSSQRKISLIVQICLPLEPWGLHIQSPFQWEEKELSESRLTPHPLPIHPYGNQGHIWMTPHQQERVLDDGTHLIFQYKKER